MRKTVIIGATGNVGGAVAAWLAQRGLPYRGAGRLSSYAEIFEGQEQLLLSTALNAELPATTAKIIAEAKAAGIQNVVKISALGADPKSPRRIHRLHGEAEAIIRESGLSWTFIRPNAFAQNFIRFYGPSIRARNVIAVPAESAKISFVDISDIAEVTGQALLSHPMDGRILEVTGPQARSFEDSARLLSAVLGREIRYVAVSETEARATLERVGVPEWPREALLELYGSYRAGEAEKVTALGHTTLERFFERNANVWKEQV